MSVTDRHYNGNQHKHSVRPMEHILNMVAPSSTRSAEIPILSGSTAESLVDMRVVTANQLFTFNSFSFFSPVPVFFSEGDVSLAAPHSQRHFFEGGRFTMTTTSPLTCMKFRPVDPPSTDITIYLIVG